MRQYEIYERSFRGEEPQGSFVSVPVEAVFSLTAEDGTQDTKTVQGFYAGNGLYKVRFLPEQAGTYTWQVTGAVAGEGQEVCEPALPDRKGVVRAKETDFIFADGSFFKPVGTTIYALAHQKKDLIRRTMESLKKAPFNKVRHCVFPKFYDYNKEDPELFAFEKDDEGNWNVDRPCFAFWDHLEQVITELSEMGIQSDLILFHPYDKWGFSQLTREECLTYLDYLLKRLSAFPDLWWSMANEFDLMYGRAPEDWFVFEEFITAHDPCRHLLSNHNCFSFYDFTRPDITHCCVQTTQLESAAMWLEKYRKPLLYDECCYEGNLPMAWGNISGFEMVHRFWQGCTAGAYVTHGEVFLDEHDILWWAKGGVLKGKSPERIAFLRRFLEELPGTLKPWKMPPWPMPEMGYMSKGPMDLFRRLHESMPPEQKEAMRVKEEPCRGHIGEEVFLEYFGHECCAEARWILPEEHTYRIEVIDVWNMTREMIGTGVNGKYIPSLPGREGIALLAIRE